jgi:hypothetical protein
MLLDPHARRFDPRCRSTPNTKDLEELLEALDADLRSAATGSTNDPDFRDFDETLEQIDFGEFRVCPLRGAVVDRNGTVVNR